MSKQRPIAYEPHPVTPERKAELRAQGYQIIDAAFRPAGYADANASPDQAREPAFESPKRRGRQTSDAA